MVLRSVARIAACPASRDPSDPSPAAASWRAVVTTSSASAVPASTRIQPLAAAASAAANGPAVAAAASADTCRLASWGDSPVIAAWTPYQCSGTAHSGGWPS